MIQLGELPLVRKLRSTAGEAAADPQSLERAAKTLASSRPEVADLLSRCRAAPALWEQLAGRAYCHPNGFYKFVLYDVPDSPFRLRLHVWTASPGQRRQQADQNVHGHRWNFASAVLAGSGLQIDEYVPCASGGETYRSYEYRPAAAAAGTSPEFAADADLALAGEARLEPSVRYTLQAGDSYSCTTDTLHTVRSRHAGLTATLVVQGPPVLAAAPVFRRDEQPAQAPARPLGDARAREVMAAAIAAIRQPASGPGC